jgi:2-C-methyl-D-erythritol 4-phosphate cytidylyltransferase
MANLKTSAIIPAAGSGKRLNNKQKKQYLEIHGKPLLFYTLHIFQKSEHIDEIVIVAPKGNIEHTRKKIVDKFNFHKVKCVVEGGEKRQDSVLNGFNNVSPDTDIVVIHDAARPLINIDMIDKVIQSAKDNGSTIAAVPVTDTLKMALDGVVKNTFPRENFWRAQTPQAFNYNILHECYDRKLNEEAIFTDEAQMVEYAGFEVKIVEGLEYNIKITTNEDFILAGLLLNEINV